MKQLLQSFGIGFLIIVVLWGIGILGAMRQEGIFGTIGFVIAGIIGYPFIQLYGADPRRPPSLLVTIAIYLSEALIIGLFVYFIFLRP
jgi:hypothetical protein